MTTGTAAGDSPLKSWFPRSRASARDSARMQLSCRTRTSCSYVSAEGYRTVQRGHNRVCRAPHQDIACSIPLAGPAGQWGRNGAANGFRGRIGRMGAASVGHPMDELGVLRRQQARHGRGAAVLRPCLRYNAAQGHTAGIECFWPLARLALGQISGPWPPPRPGALTGTALALGLHSIRSIRSRNPLAAPSPWDHRRRHGTLQTRDVQDLRSIRARGRHTICRSITRSRGTNLAHPGTAGFCARAGRRFQPAVWRRSPAEQVGKERA